MSVHTFRLDEQTELELDNLVQQTGHKKSFFLKEAVKSYLEDKADYYKAVAILEKVEKGEISTKSLVDIMEKYGISNEL